MATVPSTFPNFFADFAAGQHVPPGQSAVTAWWDRAQQQTCMVSFNPSPK